MHFYSLFKQFIRNPKQTGAVVASGPQLCRVLATTARVREAGVILELGTGTGVVTAEIMRQKSATARLIGIEINDLLAAKTQQRCPGAEIVHADAVRAREILTARGLDGCDCIVSGLPWATFPEQLQDQLLAAARQVLRPGGSFVTFAYLQGLLLPSAQRFYAKLQQQFDTVEMTPVVWANLPPAVVYLATQRPARRGRKLAGRRKPLRQLGGGLPK